VSGNPPELARLVDCGLKCVGQQLVVISVCAFSQDQVRSARALVIFGYEPSVWKAYDDIAILHLDNEVR